MLNRGIHGKPLVCLDSTAMSPKPPAMLERIQQIYAHEYARVEEGHALGSVPHSR